MTVRILLSVDSCLSAVVVVAGGGNRGRGGGFNEFRGTKKTFD